MISTPRPYDEGFIRKQVARMVEKGWTPYEIGGWFSRWGYEEGKFDMLMASNSNISCIDCGAPYADSGVDLVLPDQQWRAICPEGGVLCPTCICARARKHGATAILAWLDNLDYSVVPRENTSLERVAGKGETRTHEASE